MATNMLDYIRIMLYTLFIFLGFLLFQAWDKDHPKSEATPIVQTEKASDRFVPAIASAPSSVPQTTPTAPAIKTQPLAADSQIIKVKTDVLDVSIDTRGGDIIEAKLLHYPESLDSKVPFLLLNNDPNTRYIAQSGLLSKQGPDTSEEQALYQSPQTQYTLAPGANDLTVTLRWQKDGLTVDKIYTFKRDSYEVHVRYDVDNQSPTPWQGNLYTQLARTNTPPVNHSGMMNLTTYFGAAISSPEHPFTKIPFKHMQENNLSQTIKDGWAAMIQHYFISAWIPNKEATSNYYSRVLPNGLYTIGMIGEPLTVAPGAKGSTESTLYTGPAITDRLQKASPTLKLTVDYGLFWMFSSAIFWMMQQIYNIVGNWGWSIVIVTIIIKLMFYYLSAKSYRSMSGLKKLQPRIEQLKERYGDDRQKLTQETLALYKQEKVNPMSGCLPILVQIPVFIALYWVLVESVELRQAPFIFWIRDLSQHDPYYILPLLMGASMFLQQRLTPPPPDPMQARIMMFMPVIFTVLFLHFPAGLMLYWFVNNTLSFLQQWHIMHRMEKESNAKKETYAKKSK